MEEEKDNKKKIGEDDRWIDYTRKKFKVWNFDSTKK